MKIITIEVTINGKQVETKTIVPPDVTFVEVIAVLKLLLKQFKDKLIDICLKRGIKNEKEVENVLFEDFTSLKTKTR